MTATIQLDSPTNPRVKAWVRAIRQRELLLVEGPHPIEEALRAGVALETLLLAADATVPKGLPKTVEVITASERVLNAVANTQSPPPCVALGKRPELLSPIAFAKALPEQPRLLVLLGLQDPGNVGTLLRSARAFGCHGVVLGQPMVDVYASKVVRSTAGWHFGLPMCGITMTDGWADLLANLPAMHWLLTVGETKSVTPTAYTDVNWQGATALVMGHEGRGLLGTPELTTFQQAIETTAGHNATWVTIPTVVESLNVAVSGSILLAHQAQWRQA